MLITVLPELGGGVSTFFFSTGGKVDFGGWMSPYMTTSFESMSKFFNYMAIFKFCILTLMKVSENLFVSN